MNAKTPSRQGRKEGSKKFRFSLLFEPWLLGVLAFNHFGKRSRNLEVTQDSSTRHLLAIKHDD
jgi:hypothetical protein